MEQANNIPTIKVTFSHKVKMSEQPKITNSTIAANLFRPFYEDYMEYKEAFHVMYLNRANKVIGIQRTSEGGSTSCVVDVKQVLQPAIMANAAGIILCHNHPSGNLDPSSADIAITAQVKEAAKMFDITILDHIILTSESHTSFADEARL
jgi:DNA repair protein RadC